jgi:peptidyl-prolyl cis-trans isomerase A (cyclophilin A)
LTQGITRRAAAACLAVAIAAVAGSASAADAPKVKFATSMGDIVVEVYPDKAPKTVENFLQYVREKHYDGVIFHRVIDNFMIQTGGFDRNMVEKKTRAPIQHEGRAAAAKGLKNQVGMLAMARTNDPHSASAQFFINLKDNAFLDPTPIPPGDPVPRFEFQGRVYENVPRSQLEGAAQLYGYTVFGKVVSGMDVVNKIKAVPTAQSGMHGDVPRTPVVVQSATLLP